MRKIHINLFNSIKDNRVKPMETTWENIVGLLTSNHEINDDKLNLKLFNCVKYKNLDEVSNDSNNWSMDEYSGISYVNRRQVNIVENDVLILDYDGGPTLDEIIKRFSKYEFVYYTSYRHLYDGKTEKFRILLPFLSPIPSWKEFNKFNICTDYGEWYQIIESLKEFSGPCDPTSFNPNTIYNIPSVPESRTSLCRSGHNKGELLDWREFERIPFKKSESNNFNFNDFKLKSNQYLEPNQILETTHGPTVVSEVTGLINGVKCPFHNDKKGSEFVRKVETSGNIFLHCNTCDKNYYMKNIDHTSETITFNKKEILEPPSNEKREYTIDELLEFPDEKVYFDSSTRDRVTKQLEKIKKIINDDKGYRSSKKFPVRVDQYLRRYKSHIIYMPEGSGKSHLVINMANEGQKIIFACKAWEQVESKYDEYQRFGTRMGFNVRVVRSKEGKARKRFNTNLVRGEQRTPFSSSRILDNESVEEFIKNNPDLSPEFIRVSWNFFSSDSLSFENIPHQEISENGEYYNDYLSPSISDDNTRIILTTFEQLRIHRLKNDKIPKDWIIWFDDPDIMDVVDIEPYNIEKWDELSINQLENKTKEINGKRYFKRDPERSLGFSLKNHKCIYTTTEIITRQAIEVMMKNRNEKCIVHDDMDNISGGKITILGTKMVRKRFDGIIPLLVRRLVKQKFPTLLIADGLSSEFNHSNNKGRNDLNRINTLVELSIPHPNQVRTICDSLDLPFKENRHKITNSMILDRLHQAVGRNSGYRWEGFQCVVLVDKQVHQTIVRETRYHIDKENSVLIDRTKNMSRKDKRTTKSVTPIVQEIEYMLNNINEYISDKRKITHDINFVINSIQDNQKKTNLIVRLLVSLLELSGIKINKEFTKSKPKTTIEKKYWGIINWILETHIPVTQKEYSIIQVQKMIKEVN